MVFVTSSTNKIKELGASNQDHNWENRDRDSILFMIFIASYLVQTLSVALLPSSSTSDTAGMYCL